jgi:hypothetical protein
VTIASKMMEKYSVVQMKRLVKKESFTNLKKNCESKINRAAFVLLN